MKKMICSQYVAH